MGTPDEIHTIHQRLRSDDDLRRHATERIRCDAYERDGHWYAGPARVRIDPEGEEETCFEPPTEAFATREEAEDFARAYALHRLQDTAD